MDDFEHRQRRLDRARWRIRIELTIAIAVPLLAGFMYLAAPQFMGRPEPTLFETLLPLAALALSPIGIVWMIRLSRANPEDGPSSWRYRDF